METTFTFDSKKHTIKFNYSAFFKANRAFSELDKAGNSMNNGAAVLFNKLINQDDTAFLDVIRLYVPNKTSDEQIMGIVDEMTEEGKTVEELADEFIEEMKTSGFFRRAVNSYIKMMEKGLEMLKKKKQTEENDASISMVDSQLTSLKEAIS